MLPVVDLFPQAVFARGVMLFFGFTILGVWIEPLMAESTPVESTLRLDHPAASDQDDLCIWRDQTDPSQSLIITSDKKANLIAVFDLNGKLLQSVPLPQPGNIDIRQGVRCGDQSRDIVVVNQRSGGYRLAVFQISRSDRRLKRLDAEDLLTEQNYGLCLYHNRVTGTLYAIVTSDTGSQVQYELSVSAEGMVKSKIVRQWTTGKSEGAVADDELGRLYVSEEELGVWEMGADPDQSAPGELVIRLGEHDLKPDLEGVTLFKQSGEAGYLILSSQGQSQFFLYERSGDHRFVGKFSIAGVQDTDGIDVLAESCGPQFPNGLFGCHTASTNPCSVVVTPWERIASQLKLMPR